MLVLEEAIHIIDIFTAASSAIHTKTQGIVDQVESYYQTLDFWHVQCLVPKYYFFFIATFILTGFLAGVLFFNSSFIALIILDLLSENSLGTKTYLKT